MKYLILEKLEIKKKKNSVKTRIVKRFGYVLVNLQVGSKREGKKF